MEGVVVVSDGYEYGRWLLGASFPHSWSLCEYNSLTVVTTRSQPMSQQMNAAVSVALTRSADGRDDRESFVAKRIRSVRNAWHSLRTSAPAACGLSLHLVRFVYGYTPSQIFRRKCSLTAIRAMFTLRYSCFPT